MRPEFAGRQATIYLDTHRDLERWKKLAKSSTLTLNRWVIETVEAAIETPRESRSGDSNEVNQLRKENLELKQANERLAARLSEVEEVYEKSTQIHSHLDKGVVDLLLSGDSWTSPKITEKLLIADKNEYKKFFTESHNEFKKVDRVKGINRTLEQLELVGLIKETRSGWVWNKK